MDWQYVQVGVTIVVLGILYFSLFKLYSDQQNLPISAIPVSQFPEPVAITLAVRDQWLAGHQSQCLRGVPATVIEGLF